MTRLIVLLTASAMFLANCSGSTTPASPSPASPMPSPAGIWVGSFSDPVAGEGSARLTLTEEEPAGSGGFALQRRLVGTWAVTFRNGETVEGRAEATLLPAIATFCIWFPFLSSTADLVQTVWATTRSRMPWLRPVVSRPFCTA